MKIYHYDFETGQYLGEGEADPSPLEEGVWLIPAHATDIVPPKTKTNEYAIFINNDWSVYAAVEPEITEDSNIDVPPPIRIQDILSGTSES
jgi:hypothetical protein